MTPAGRIAIIVDDGVATGSSMHWLQLPWRHSVQRFRKRRRAEVNARAYALRLLDIDASFSGKPYREILRLAADRASELIVMGVQGRGAADLLLFGSTTHQVVCQATCPVLTLRERDK